MASMPEILDFGTLDDETRNELIAALAAQRPDPDPELDQEMEVEER